eukprot:TRINITY_DN16124_c0_g1_i3.p1 TRINITY_DN16124_c0_g1~~TRINITY_DN16124_c0_g1_i3.p1  ORF type:complete len:105 (-),score=31.64 TRINITY_DN16124_c0_g1_i3:164-478(-)
MIRRPPRSTLSSSSAASDVYKRQDKKRSKKSKKEKKSKEKDKEKGEKGTIRYSEMGFGNKEADEVRYSAVSGKKILMKKSKDKQDKAAAANRSQLLMFLNASYD